MKIQSKRTLFIALLTFAGFAGYYAWQNSSQLPYVFGVNNGVEFGKHSVRMRAGWYPYEVNGRTQAVSLVRGGPLAFMSPPGYVHVHFMDHPNEEFIKAIKENSSAYGKYGWGTALVLNKSFYTNVLKITPNTSKTTVFVPELNAMIDVLNIADLDDIRTLASRE